MINQIIGGHFMKNLLLHFNSIRFTLFLSVFWFSTICSCQVFAQGAGKALNFNGTHKYVSVSNSSTLNVTNAMTMEAWMKPSEENWNCQVPITLNPATPEADYQVKVELTTSNFTYSLAKSDGSDIRFYDGNGTELNYWIEKWDALGTSIIWVKVPAAGTTEIFMYYGNPSAQAVSNATNTFVRVIDSNSPVKGSWHLDEGSGTTAYDRSGNGNNGTLYNSPTWVDGKFGEALSFDGSNDYVQTPIVSNTLTDFTMEAWVKASSVPGDRRIVMGSGWQYNDWYIGINLGSSTGAPARKWLFWVAGNSEIAYLAAPDEIVAGDWYYLVATYQGTTGKFYINGDSIGSFTFTRKTDTNPFRIGCSNSKEYFNGLVDEVRVYNRALTSEEVSDLYQNYGYTTTNAPGKVFVRKYSTSEPIATLGNETFGGISKAGSFQMGTNISKVYASINNQTIYNESSSFKYNRKITFTPATSVANYQFKIELNASDFDYSKTKADGSDIRFYDANNTELNYWIENWNISGTSTLWVKVPTIGTDKIYMYYGNPYNQDVSNANNTFVRVIDGNSLKGSWNFDEGSGSIAYDKSGNNNNGTLTNNSSYSSPGWVDGKYGKALSFNGNNWVDCGTNSSLNTPPQFTQEAWIYPTITDDSYHGFLGYQPDDNTPSNNVRSACLYVSEKTRLHAGFGNVTYWNSLLTGYNVITQNTWNHVVATFDGIYYKIYVNGIEKYYTSALEGKTPYPTPIRYIGRVNDYFKGSIDEVRIYNRALTSEEISDLYQNYGYTTTNAPGKVFIRKYSASEPTVTIGEEISLEMFSLSGWNHIAQTYDGSTQKLYLNGVLVASQTLSGEITANANDLLIGDMFNGTIDEVRLWDVARTEEEIRANMCKKLDGDESGLIGYWRLDEGTGTTANDETGNNNGTLTNSPTWVWSGAAIGDASAYDYEGTQPGDFSVNLAHTDGDNFTVTGEGGTITGIQIYRIDEAAMRDGSIKPSSSWNLDPYRYWGVFAIGTNPTYSLTYQYGSHPGIDDENDLGLAKRDNLADDSWEDANATLNTENNTLVLTDQSGTEYALGSKTGKNNFIITKTSDVKTNHFSLSQNQPNPFVTTTIIRYELPERNSVVLKVYDLFGREVTTLFEGEQNAGKYEVEFNGTNLPSGIYFCQMQAGNFMAVRKLLLLK